MAQSRREILASALAEAYRRATSRVTEMTDDEMSKWYAHAVTQYAALTLRRDHHDAGEGDGTSSPIPRQDGWAAEAADLLLAIDARLSAERATPGQRPAFISIKATIHR